MVYTVVLEATAERIESSSLSLRTKGYRMEDINIYEFGESMKYFEEKLEGIDFVIEQVEGPTEEQDLWCLEIFDQKIHFQTLDEVKTHLHSIVDSRIQ